MRIDDAGPRTWLLAGVAGWALVAWLLAVAGMGGRVEPLPDDPTLLQPLPPVRPAPPPRLGPPDQYAQIADRPLFSSDRTPQPFFLQGQGEPAESSAFDYQLTSVLITPRLKLAIIQPADGSESVRVRLGDAPESHPAWRLTGLSERSAVFEGPDGQRTLGLRVFDGVGGARPTEIGSPATDDASAVPPPASSATPARAADPMDAQADADARVESGAADAVPSTDQARMDAIRERIQARRARLRGETPPVPDATSPPRPQPPAMSP